MKPLLTFILTFILRSSASFGQLTVDTVLTMSDITEAIQGPDVTIQNLTTHCRSNGLGSFSGDSQLPFSTGVAMITGNAMELIGPNNAEGDPSGTLDFPTNDQDLPILLHSSESMWDGCQLEFDAISNSDSVFIDFIFASEEYPEYVCSEFNDGMGIFISGPEITGTYTDEAENIAVVPFTDIPISVNTVNNGITGEFGVYQYCALLSENWNTNQTYFIDNGDGTEFPSYDDPSYIQFDGYTTRITSNRKVHMLEPYHIKIIVAELVDGAVDSGILLPEGAVRGTHPQASSTQALSKPLQFTMIMNENTLIIHNLDRSQQDVTCELMDVTGRVLRAFLLSSPQVCVNDLSSGVYLVRLSDGHGSITRRLFKP